jgi:predicted transcriptional regulator
MPKLESKLIDHVALAADIVSAYVTYNSVPAIGLPDLIHSVHTSLSKLASSSAAASSEHETLLPAVSVRRSITSDYLICLDDGKKFKSLKRHLTTLGMTPDQYRQKWNLPRDYPMVPPAYSSKRSELAKKIGLGQLRKGKYSLRTPDAEEKAAS